MRMTTRIIVTIVTTQRIGEKLLFILFSFSSFSTSSSCSLSLFFTVCSIDIEPWMRRHEVSIHHQQWLFISANKRMNENKRKMVERSHNSRNTSSSSSNRQHSFLASRSLYSLPLSFCFSIFARLHARRAACACLLYTQ